MRGRWRVVALVLAVVVLGGVLVGVEFIYGRTIGRSVVCIYTAESPAVQRADVGEGGGYIEASDPCQPCMVRVKRYEHIVVEDEVAAEVVLPCGGPVNPDDYLDID